MPAISPSQLVTALLDAIEASSHSGALLSPVRQHPRKFAIATPDDQSVSVWVYAWTLTHGGRPSLSNEYRIQMTTVSSPLAMNPNGYTCLLGYEPDLQMFAGFDLSRHQAFTIGSPSVQIDIRTVRKALQDGLAFDRKSNQEIAIGIRPDQLMTYVANATAMHRYGGALQTYNLLERASSMEDIPDDELSELTKPRQRIVQTVRRLARSANFRQQVMHAYGHRCAVTRMQLRLVDAAHILPVGSPGSIDTVRNGLALSPTYHRAYDNGLIYLDDSLTMKINPAKEAQLAALKLDGGIVGFKSSLGKIHLPPDKTQWPNKAFIKKANGFRLIA
ncbi:MAG: HNH endonuclease signature motif containing protein [Pirellulales bacterium]